MRNLLKRLGEMGKTIIVSSHILPELADVCNKIGIIHRGVMDINGPVSELMERIRRQIVLWVQVAERTEEAGKVLARLSGVEKVQQVDGRWQVTLHESQRQFDHVAAELVGGGFRLTELREEIPSLEAAFMTFTQGIQH
jgi:ABC-2 type transport system ATP-binding protein